MSNEYSPKCKPMIFWDVWILGSYRALSLKFSIVLRHSYSTKVDTSRYMHDLCTNLVQKCYPTRDTSSSHFQFTKNIQLSFIRDNVLGLTFPGAYSWYWVIGKNRLIINCILWDNHISRYLGRDVKGDPKMPAVKELRPQY